MKNLCLVGCRCQCVAAAASPSGSRLCVDPITHTVYHVDTLGIRCLTQDGDADVFPGVWWCQHDLSVECLVLAEVLTSSASLCVVTGAGEVLTVTTDTAQVDVVGSVPCGVEAASWSPDQELLVLVTAEGNLVLMTAAFDPVAETPVQQETFGARPFITLGWGKKETQFHGSEGKAAAVTARTPACPAPSWDDHRPRVTWRGDGELFAVSYFMADSGTRKVVVVSREGVIQATGELLDGLEPPLAWRPSGAILATTQTTTTKHEVTFIEKNGLKHGGFVLPFKPGTVEVVELAWSPDSSILAVWVRPGPGEGHGDIVQLWTTGNHHWYLKRELKYGGGAGKMRDDSEKDEVEGGLKEEGRGRGDVGEEDKNKGTGERGVGNVRYMRWDESDTPTLTLYILTDTRLFHYSWLLVPHASLGHTPLDLASIGVVDGATLKLTPFRQVIVPPPMSAYEVTFPASINSLVFCSADSTQEGDVEDSGFLEWCDHPGSNSNSLCVQHGSNSLTILAQTPPDYLPASHGCSVVATGIGGEGFKTKVKLLGVFSQYEVEWPLHVLPRPSGASDLYNWVWPAKNTLLACFSEEDTCYLVFLELHEVGTEASRVVASAVVPVEDSVVAISSLTTFAALQLASGALLKLDLATQTLEPFTVEGAEVQFPAMCQRVSMCQLDNGSKVLPLGLTARNRLYLGHKQLLANCTSYHLHTHHLLLTTSAHILLAVPLTTEAMTKLSEGVAEGWSRKVERGARIVSAVPHDTRVILQMPRGNLEVVSPRPLVLHALAHLLAGHKYQQAVELARRHRIDTNFLYDHNPTKFLASVEHFVRDVDDPQRVDLFLANLTETDVTTTTYGFPYPNRSPATAEGKVATVCEAVRGAMVAVDEGRYLFPILTSLVKADQMEAALTKIKEMRDAVEGGQAFQVTPDEGLRHLLYLADVEELYRVALGTYDLGLAVMVAEKSQKDPKEYLPLLNELRTLAEPLRRFRINVLLRRFRLALESLRDSAEHMEELLALVEAEKLYPDALQVLPANSEVKTAVCEKYGRHLLASNRLGEAAIMLGRAGELEAALDVYQRAGNWRMALVTGSQLGMAKDRMAELCLALAASLREQARHKEAAQLYEQHLANEEEAVECLVQAGEWADALRLAHKHNRPDLIQTHIQPGTLQHTELACAEINCLVSSLTQHSARLGVVRQAKEKQQQQAEQHLATDTEAQLDAELYSDTSTVTGLDHSTSSHRRSSASTTSSSSRSQRSSKNRRKLERKKYSTKEGSTHEDLGLVAALHETYTAISTLADTVGPLGTALIILGLDGEVANLQESFSGLIKLAERKKNEIWPPHVPLGQAHMEFGPEMNTEGVVRQVRAGQGGTWVTFAALRLAELEPHLRYPPSPPRQDWRLDIL